MSQLEIAIPVLPVLDVPAAADRFRLLGFTVDVLDPAIAEYAFATRDQVTLHLSGVPAHPDDADVCVYLNVHDADALYAEWSTARVDGRLSAPQDTPWGMREGNYIDPDGLLFRFCSPLARHT